MPLLIFHCRTRLFLAVIQQRTILVVSGLKLLFLPAQERSMICTLFPTILSVLILLICSITKHVKYYLIYNFKMLFHVRFISIVSLKIHGGYLFFWNINWTHNKFSGL